MKKFRRVHLLDKKIRKFITSLGFVQKKGSPNHFERYDDLGIDLFVLRIVSHSYEGIPFNSGYYLSINLGRRINPVFNIFQTYLSEYYSRFHRLNTTISFNLGRLLQNVDGYDDPGPFNIDDDNEVEKVYNQMVSNIIDYAN